MEKVWNRVKKYIRNILNVRFFRARTIINIYTYPKHVGAKVPFARSKIPFSPEQSPCMLRPSFEHFLSPGRYEVSKKQRRVEMNDAF